MANIAGAILAGGKSSRMGEDKANLELNGKTLLEHKQQILRKSGIENIFISHANHIPDIIADLGPLGGIYSILQKVGTDFQYVIFLPIDMPKLNVAMIEKLITTASKADLVYFKSHKMPFSLSTNKKWLGLAKTRLLKNGNLSLGAFFADISEHHQIELSSDEIPCLLNINTPQQWNKYRQGLKNKNE